MLKIFVQVWAAFFSAKILKNFNISDFLIAVSNVILSFPCLTTGIFLRLYFRTALPHRKSASATVAHCHQTQKLCDCRERACHIGHRRRRKHLAHAAKLAVGERAGGFEQFERAK